MEGMMVAAKSMLPTLSSEDIDKSRNMSSLNLVEPTP